MTRTLIIVVCLIAMLLLSGWWVNSVRRVQRPGTASRVEPEMVTADTGMVGEASCRQCHSGIAKAYETSGHAHTFRLTTESDLARQLAGVDFKDPLRQRSFHYDFGDEGLAVSLPTVFGDERFPLTYALGSGTHAVTFLTLLPHRNAGTVGLEHRATYYKQLQGLGLTVGHPYLSDPIEDAEHFGKVLDERKLLECLGCHTTQVAVADHHLANLIPQVGCEKCHGPGKEHVEAKHAGLAGPDVSSARRWPTAMSEVRTCGTCHRLPESLKPSELVRSSRVLPRFQPAGLIQSRCFTKSDGMLRCTTCHNPHENVSSDKSRYERICLECHQPEPASICRQSNDGCINCHMPKVAFEGVASFHDHWIRVRNEEDPAPLPKEASPEPP